MFLVGVALTASAENLDSKGVITKHLKLIFNEQAKNSDAFVSWELSGDWNKFNYHFSQGNVKNNVYTIRAKDYKDFVSSHDGITLTIKGKSNTAKGNYELSMKVKDVSKGLQFPKQKFNLNLGISYTPPSLLKRFMVPGIIVLAIALLSVLILHLTAKFPGGLLQLGTNEVSMKGKKEISVKKELADLGVFLDEDVDVIFVKKRFGAFKGPSIKEMRNCSLERDGVFLSRGNIILQDEDIHGLTDINGEEILIRYC